MKQDSCAVYDALVTEACEIAMCQLLCCSEKCFERESVSSTEQHTFHPFDPFPSLEGLTWKTKTSLFMNSSFMNTCAHLWASITTHSISQSHWISSSAQCHHILTANSLFCNFSFVSILNGPIRSNLVGLWAQLMYSMFLAFTRLGAFILSNPFLIMIHLNFHKGISSIALQT